MSTKINKHVFHEFYSNGYNNLDDNKFWGKLPIHVTRSFFGAKDPYNQQSKILEFDSEESALRWYKKNRYTENVFNKLKFPSEFCKNYFTISQSEFSEFRGYFDRMIKGIKFSSDVEILFEGTDIQESCSETKEDSRSNAEPGDVSGTITFNSPDGKPSYFKVDGGADDIGYLNGQKITEGNTATYFSQDLIPKEPATTLSFYAQDTVGYNVGISATVTWLKILDYKQKIKYLNNFESAKVFDISNLEKRIGSDNIGYSIEIFLNQDNCKEELFLGENDKIFKDKWEFDGDAFKSIFSQEDKFNKNTTLLNDPVLLRKDILSYFNNIINYRNWINNIYYIENDEDISEVEKFEKQKNYNKNFSRFGEVNYTLENENSILNASRQNLYIELTDIIYIKSKKIYLCFVELIHYIDASGSPAFTRKCEGDEEEQVVKNGITNPTYAHYIFTTNDSIKDPDEEKTYPTSQCTKKEEETKIEIIYDTFDLKIKNKTFQIECHTLKQKEFIWDNSVCEDLDEWDKKKKNKTTITINKKPTIEILSWQDSDFTSTNIFPPKIS